MNVPIRPIRFPSIRPCCSSEVCLLAGTRQVEFFGRRGKPVKKMRLIPAEKAFAFARKLQGTPGCTVSVC
jgi:hypothetical protein